MENTNHSSLLLRKPRWVQTLVGTALIGLIGLTWWGLARRAALRRGFPAIHPQHAELYARREAAGKEREVRRLRRHQ